METTPCGMDLEELELNEGDHNYVDGKEPDRWKSWKFERVSERGEGK